jgi:nitrous oxidase accessory protein
VRADSVTLEDRHSRHAVRRLSAAGTGRGAAAAGHRGARGLGEGQRGDGIYLHNSRGVVAEANRITYVRDGIYFSYSDSARISDNRVSHVRFGLHYMFSHRNRFERNVFTDNAAGAVLMNSTGVVVADNVFAWNAGVRSYGLVLQTATEPVVRSNSFVGNGIGVFFDNVIDGVFEDNVVAGNWLGLQLFANSERTRITGNTMAGNTFDATGRMPPARSSFASPGKGTTGPRPPTAEAST